MRSPRQQITAWAEHGQVNDLPQALEVAKAYPDNASGIRFIDQLMLWLGCLALGAGVIFFIAYNWSKLGRFGKYALVEGAMLAAGLVYWRLADHSRPSVASLLLLSLLTGTLLALTGQTYQTGADPWELFAVWAAMILPWTLLARSSVLWVLWAVLCNVALLLYLSTFGGLFGLLFDSEETWLWLFTGLNSALLVGFECLAVWGGRIQLNNRLAAQVAAIAAGWSVSWLAIWSILEADTAYGLLAWGLWIAVVFVVYRYCVLDLLILAGGVLSVIVVMSAGLGKSLESALDEGVFLLISLLIIGVSTVGGLWLKQLAAQQAGSTDDE